MANVGQKTADFAIKFIEKFIRKEMYDKKTNLEWFIGPDKGTNYDEIKSWVDNLNEEEIKTNCWRLPTEEELKSIYKSGTGTRNIRLPIKITGWRVWLNKSKSLTSEYYRFSFFDGVSHQCCYLDRKNCYEDTRGFAVRSRIEKPRKITKSYSKLEHIG